MLALVLSAVTVLAAAPETELAVGIRSENRAGLASITPGADPSGVADFILTPSLALAFYAPTGGLRFFYRPRLFQRVPLSAGFKPLAFHQMEAIFDWRMTERWSLGLSVRGGIGAVNYTYLPSAFQAGNPDSLQDQPVADETVSFGNVTAAVSNDIRLGPTTRLRFGANGQYSEATGGGVSMSTTIPRQVRGTVAAGFTFTPNGRDGLDILAGGDVASYLDLPGSDVGFLNLRVGWIRTVSRRTQCSAHVGAIALFSPRNKSGAPAGDLGCSFGLVRMPELRGTLQVQLGVQGYADPVIQDVTPRAVASLGLAFQLPPDWNIGLVGSFYTPIAGPRPGAGSSQFFTETLLEGRLPITYRFSTELSVEFGGRFLLRGPRFSNPAFRFGSAEGQGYVAIAFGYSTRTNRHSPGAQ